MGALMSVFATPQPLAVTVEASIRADVWITASARDDTTVAVEPRSAARGLDVRAAEQTVVEHTDGRIIVRLRSVQKYSWFSDGGAVDVVLHVPIGCDLDVTTGMGDLRCEGEFRSAELRTGMGSIRVDHCGRLRARTGHGHVDAERITGRAEVATGSGKVRIGDVDGDAEVRNGNGDTYVEQVTGQLRVKAGNGDIVVDRLGGVMTGTAVNGDIRVGEVASGKVTLRAAAGSLDIGVREDTSAWLELATKYGRVHNELRPADGPGEPAVTVEVRAHSAYGDITVRRAPLSITRRNDT